MPFEHIAVELRPGTHARKPVFFCRIQNLFRLEFRIGNGGRHGHRCVQTARKRFPFQQFRVAVLRRNVDHRLVINDRFVDSVAIHFREKFPRIARLLYRFAHDIIFVIDDLAVDAAQPYTGAAIDQFHFIPLRRRENRHSWT